MKLYIIGFLIIISLVGCSAERNYQARYSKSATMQEESRSSFSKRRSTRKTNDQHRLTKQKGKKEVTTQARKIHYNGDISLRATKVNKVLEDSILLVRVAGGYIENRFKNRIVFRVPVKKFQTIYQKILKLGDVLKKSMTAVDVSQAFFSIQLRLNVTKKTKKRLLELLRKVKTEKEKLKLLKEIQRVTEELEYLQNQLKTLESLSNFSRLTLSVQPRIQFQRSSARSDIDGFYWIYNFSPSRRSVAYSGALLELKVPKGFVLLNKDDLWIVESADNSVFWASEKEVNPIGKTDFWFEVIQLRLKNEFQKTSTKKIGNYKLLRMVGFGDKPYIYWIAIQVVKEKLQIIEAFFPSVADEKKYQKEIIQSIKKGKR
ncbi:MAG: hypothetical protein ACI86H_000777 [bacterium]|jgi:hypothetical protein